MRGGCNKFKVINTYGIHFPHKLSEKLGVVDAKPVNIFLKIVMTYSAELRMRLPSGVN